MPDTPYSIIDNEQSRLEDFYGNMERQLRLRKLPKAQHNAEIANMQSGYDAQKFKITSMRIQLDNIRESDIDPTLRDEAMWRLVIPPEHAAAMFPTVKKPAERVPISPPGLKTHLGMMTEFAEAAPRTREFFTREKLEPRAQEGLIREYLGWREAIGYTNYTPGQQRQLDIQWDDLMADRPKYKWDPESSDIKALRTYGGRITGIVAKKISPLARSVEEAKPRTYKRRLSAVYSAKPTQTLMGTPIGPAGQLDTNTARTILQEASGDKIKARQIARQRGYEL